MNIEQISKEYGIDINELKKLQEHLLNKYKPAIEDEDTLLKLVERGVQHYVKRKVQKGGNTFYGILLSVSQVRNSTEKRRNSAIAIYKENPEQAVEKGYIEEFTETEDGRILSRKLDKNGNVVQREVLKIHEDAVLSGNKHILPLYQNKTFNSGKPNFNYLEPMPINEFFTNIEGLYSTGETDFTRFKMIMNTDTTDIVFPVGKPVKFMAKEKDKGVLTPTSMTKFEVIEGNIDKSLINKFFPVLPFSSLEQYLRKYDLLCIEGQVMDLFISERTGWVSTVVQELTTDESIKVMFHPNIEVNFGTESIIKAFGTVSMGKKWDTELKQPSETEEEMSFFATGYYPIVLVGADEQPDEIQSVEEDEWED